MVCFVMALKSEAVSRVWSRVSMLCEAAVQSAWRQTDRDIRIILVCHEKPDFRSTFDDRLEIIRVDFAVPVADPKAAMLDKWKKLAVGMVRAGALSPDFVMNMDADDLVSNRIAAWARAHPRSNGAVIRRGYVYRPGSRWIAREDQYNCGTNAIVSARLIKFPKDISEQSVKECSILRSGHMTIEADMAQAGTPLDVLPFRAGIYVSGHGDNWSPSQRASPLARIKSFLKHPLRLRPCSAAIREEFAMQYLPT